MSDLAEDMVCFPGHVRVSPLLFGGIFSVSVGTRDHSALDFTDGDDAEGLPTEAGLGILFTSTVVEAGEL